MKTPMKYLTFLMVFGLFSMNASAGQTGSQEQISSPNETAAQAGFSPRQYCHTSGGEVRETANSDIYLCCYEKKAKCVVSDTRQTISWSVKYDSRTDTVKQLLERLGDGSFKDSHFLAQLVRSES